MRSALSAHSAVLAALALATLAALPAAAAAKPGHYVTKPSKSALFRTRGTNSYTIEVSAHRGRALLSARGSGVRRALSRAKYTVRARFVGNRLVARFARLGRISLRFDLARATQLPSSTDRNCKGRKPSIYHGRFVGTFRFRGEHGFTRIRTSSVDGLFVRAYRQVCKRKKTHTQPDAPLRVTGVAARSTAGPRSPAFSAGRIVLPELGEAGLSEFTAATVERRSGMTIHRSVSAGGGWPEFVLSARDTFPVTATVEPPAPYSGSAVLRKVPGGPVTWTGDLSVELPGRGRVRLAGPSFVAAICRETGPACLEPPIRPAGPTAGRAAAG